MTVNVAPDPNPQSKAPDAQILVNGGTNTTIVDTDSQPGETVTFEARPFDPIADPIPDTLRLEWFVGDETSPRQSGLGPQAAIFKVALPDGAIAIKVVGTDSVDQSSGMLSTVVTVGAAASFAQLPGLAPNQTQVAAVLDRMCNDSTQTTDTERAERRPARRARWLPSHRGRQPRPIRCARSMSSRPRTSTARKRKPWSSRAPPIPASPIDSARYAAVHTA